MKTLPEQITQTFWIGLTEFSGEPRLYTVDMSKYGDIMFGKVEVTVPVPDDLKDPTQARIDSLRIKRDDIQNKAMDKLQAIDDAIRELEAIEYQEETA